MKNIFNKIAINVLLSKSLFVKAILIFSVVFNVSIIVGQTQINSNYGTVRVAKDSSFNNLYSTNTKRFVISNKDELKDSSRFGRAFYYADKIRKNNDSSAFQLKERDINSKFDWNYKMPPIISYPSPNAMAEINNGDFGVNGYTGSFNYSIPLHNLKSYSLELPISLNYNTTGNKVDDIASWVGLGWNLSSGGSISRVMMGMPDEYTGVYKTIKGITLDAYGFINLKDETGIDLSNFVDGNYSNDQKTEIIRNADWNNLIGDEPNAEAWDTQPDEFYYNFAGYSGMFVFNQDKKIESIPNNNLKIKEYYTDVLFKGTLHKRISMFTVETAEGIVYTFGDLALSSVELSQNIQVQKNIPYVYDFFKKDSIFAYGHYIDINYWKLPKLKYIGDGNVEIISEKIEFNPLSYSSTWFLSKISSSNGDEINFIYEDAEESLWYFTKRGESVFLPNLFGLYANVVDSITGEIVYTNPLFVTREGDLFPEQYYQQVSFTRDEIIIHNKILRSIITKSGNRIEFILSNRYREDVFFSQKALRRINIYNINNKKVNSFDLDYFYSNQYGSYKPKLTYHLGEDDHDIQGWVMDEYVGDVNDDLVVAEQKRLFLKCVHSINPSTSAIGEGTLSHTFVYNSKVLPRRALFHSDAYGYYTDNNYGTKIPRIKYKDYFMQENMSSDYNDYPRFFSWSIFDNSLSPAWKGANINANLEFCKAGVLEEINLPLGGKIKISYGLNRIIHSQLGEIPWYGLRVEKIDEYPDFENNTGLCYSKKYNYDNGAASIWGNGFYSYYKEKEMGHPLYVKKNFVYNFSNTLAKKTLTRGGTIGYKNHSIVVEDNGSQSIIFKNPSSDMIPRQKSPVYARQGEEGNFDLIESTFTYPFPPDFYNDWQRGKQDKLEMRDINDKLISIDELNHVFEHDNFVSNEIVGLIPGVVSMYTNETEYKDYYAGIYSYKTNPHTVIKSTKTTYSSNDNKSISTVVDNEYNVKTYDNQQYVFLQETSQIDSKGVEQKISYKYPMDINDPSEVFMTQTDLNELLDKNMLNTVLKTEIVNGSTNTDGQITTFKTEAGTNMSLPAMTSLLVGSIYEHKSYYLYDEHGNIVQSTEIDGAEAIPIAPQYPPEGCNTTYLWGYNYKYPIAKIENAKYDDAIEAIGIDYDVLQTKNSEELKTIFQGLIENAKSQSHVLHSSMINAYTYNPLIGMTSEIDPNGNIKTYHYDDFNRLTTIKDEENIILKHFEYNLIGSSPVGYVIIFPNEITFNFNAFDDIQVLIESNDHWEVEIDFPEGEVPWLTCDPMEGNGDMYIRIAAEKNWGDQIRTFAVYIKPDNGNSQILTVKQTPQDDH